MVCCAVSQCKRRSNTSNFNTDGVSFHIFPKIFYIRQKWIEFCQRGTNWTPTRTSVICSDHFEPGSYCLLPNNRRKLDVTAVPTLHICYCSNLPVSVCKSVHENKKFMRGGNFQAESIIASVYEYLQLEYEQLKNSIGNDYDLSPLANILQRTAAATGVSEQAVSAILEEKERAAGEELIIDTSDAKRAKMSRDYGNGNVRPKTDDESSCEAPDKEHDELTEQTTMQTRNESQESVDIKAETLKVEIKEEVDQESVDIEVGTLQVDIKEEVDQESVDIEVETLQVEIKVEVDESTKASTTEAQTITSRKRKKSNAQRCKEYREKKKLQNSMGQNITAERLNVCNDTDQLQAKRPKTNAERRKKHYEAQKLKRQKIKKIPKTVKQKNKEYYERKKKLKALILNHHSNVEGPLDPLHLHMSEMNATTSTNAYAQVHESKPPAVLVYPQSSSGVLPMISIEPMTSLATVKTEPDDDPPNSDTTIDVVYNTSIETIDTTACVVKLEPPSPS